MLLGTLPAEVRWCGKDAMTGVLGLKGPEDTARAREEEGPDAANGAVE